MNKATNRLHEGIDNGWSIQVYSRDRRLLCSLYPSHGWAFFAGIILGFFVALVSLQGHSTAHSSSVSPPMEAPLNLD
jgi:hypothetical protein